MSFGGSTVRRSSSDSKVLSDDVEVPAVEGAYKNTKKIYFENNTKGYKPAIQLSIICKKTDWIIHCLKTKSCKSIFF